MIVRAERLVTEAGERRDAWLRIEGGLVVGVDPPDRAEHEPVEELDGVVLPGFVDGHVHGALGHDFASCSVEEARVAAAHHLAAGATDLVATIATAPLPVLEERLALLAPLVHEGVLAGLHLEGPYLSAERRGAHEPALLRRPDPAELERLVEAADGALLQLTIAPELPGALGAVRSLAARGVRVSLGHTACDAATAVAALAAGASGFTHLFNGMPPLAGRAPGPVGAALASDAHLELIGDGEHLAAETVDLVVRVAAGRVSLVSDAMAATGLADGAYTVAGSAVDVTDGVARTRSGSLAGSTMTLGRAVARRAATHGVTPELASLSSDAAARFLGLRRGLAAGSRADLVQLRDDGSGSLGVHRVLRAGRWVATEPDRAGALGG